MMSVSVSEQDKEWFQIIESGINYHPISKTDALNRLIKVGKELRRYKSVIFSICNIVENFKCMRKGQISVDDLPGIVKDLLSDRYNHD